MQEMLYNMNKFFFFLKSKCQISWGCIKLGKIKCNLHKIKQSMKMHHFTELFSHIHYINVLTH